MEALDPSRDGPDLDGIDPQNVQAIAGLFKAVLGRSQNASSKPPRDITPAMVLRNHNLVLPPLGSLKEYLLHPPLHPFPVSAEAYQLVSKYNVDGMFSCGAPDEYCVRLSNHLVYILNRPPQHGVEESSYIPLWNVMLHDTLSIFMLQEIKFSRNTNQGTFTPALLPSYAGYLETYFALWRGEEQGLNSAGDPRQELLNKLVWVYEELPYLMAYYAKGGRVTLTALFSKGDDVDAADLLNLDLDKPKDRLRTVLVMFNLSKILSNLATVCRTSETISDIFQVPDSGTGKRVIFSADRVVKEYSSFSEAKRVLNIYKSLNRVPNAEKCKTRALSRKRKLEDPDEPEEPEEPAALEMAPRCSHEPLQSDELAKAVLDVSTALQYAHTTVRFMHRDVTWKNVGYDDSAECFTLLDWDEACSFPRKRAHQLCAKTHAPEMSQGLHTAAVDVWGIGHLIRTASGVKKSPQMRKLARDCLKPDPDARPSIDECVARLEKMQ